MAVGDLSSAQFVPSNLRERELYRRTVRLIDGTACDAYSPHLRAALHAFDPRGDGFDAEAALASMGGAELATIIIGRRPQVSDTDPATGAPYVGLSDPAYLEAVADFVRRSSGIAHVLPRLINLKGTRPGLRMLLRLSGVDAQEIIGWEVWRGAPANPDRSDGPITSLAPQGAYRKAYEDFAAAFPSVAATITEDSRDDFACKVYFAVGIGGDGSSGDTALSGLARDARITDVVRRFMPACAQVIVEVTNDLPVEYLRAGPGPGDGRDRSRGPDSASGGASISAAVPEDGSDRTSRRAPTDADAHGGLPPGGSADFPLRLSDDVARDDVNINQLPIRYGAGQRYAGVGDPDPPRHASAATSTGVSVYEALDDPIAMSGGSQVDPHSDSDTPI